MKTSMPRTETDTLKITYRTTRSMNNQTAQVHNEKYRPPQMTTSDTALTLQWPYIGNIMPLQRHHDHVTMALQMTLQRHFNDTTKVLKSHYNDVTNGVTMPLR